MFLVAKRIPVLAVSCVMLALAVRAGSADSPAVQTIQAAVLANEKALANVETQLKQEEHRLARLAELQGAGHATWREVAEQRIAVDSLRSQRNAAIEFADFATALLNHSEQCDGDDCVEFAGLDCSGWRSRNVGL